MRLVGKENLQSLMLTDEAVSVWVSAWVAEIASANWKQPLDISDQFPNVIQSDSNQFVFPITGCKQKIALRVGFPQGIAVITGLQ